MVKVLIAGDSTAAAKADSEKPMSGWGEYLAKYLNGLEVQNYAINGRSTKSFIDLGDFDKLLNNIKQDDIVFIQFGHNDEKIEDSNRYTTPTGGFIDNLKYMTGAIKEREGIAILGTPINRRSFDENGKLEDTHQVYAQAMRNFAQQISSPLIDMNKITKDEFKKLGLNGTQKYFLNLDSNESSNYPDGLVDNTHFSVVGAQHMAELIAQGIKPYLK